MKTKLILLFLVLSTLNISAQINYSDSTVQAITYWDLNESYIYEIAEYNTSRKSDNVIKSDSMKYKVQITVIDSTETSYTIKWQFLEYEVTNLELTPELKTLLENKRYVYTTNELGQFEELINWEEIRDNTVATTKASLNLALDNKNTVQNYSLRNFINTLTSSLMSKEYIEQKIIEQVLLFHTFFGVEYKLGEMLKTEMEIPNPIIPSQNFTARGEVWLDEILEEYDSYVLCYEQSVDQEKLKEFIGQFLKKMAGQMDVEQNINDIDEELSENLVHSVKIYTEFDNSGWALDFINIVNINMGDNYKHKTIRMQLIE